MSEAIDYESVLRRYIQHVSECEGTDFLHDGERQFGRQDFTDEEWAALQRLRDEGDEQWRAPRD